MSFYNEDTKWRKRKTTDGEEVEVAFTDIAGYLVCAVRYNGSIGLSFCAPSDREMPEWSTDKSVDIAFARRHLKCNNTNNISYAVEAYTFIAMQTLFFNVPHAVERSIRKTFTIKVVKKLKSRCQNSKTINCSGCKNSKLPPF